MSSELVTNDAPANEGIEIMKENHPKECDTFIDHDNDEESSKDGKSPTEKFLKTGLIFISFLFLGISDCIGGPTLLDLRDLLHTDISRISFYFTIGSIGSLVGGFCAGFVLDHYSRYKDFIMSFYHVLVAVSNIVLPFSGNIYWLYAIAFVLGFGGGSLDLGGNVMILDIWKGGESGPYMHSVHFSFGLGAFLAPVLATPFLSKSTANTTNSSNSTYMTSSLQEFESGSEEQSGMYTVYPLLGSAIAVVSLGFLFFGITSVRKSARDQTKDKIDEESEQKFTPTYAAFLALIFTFFFLYVGIEVVYIKFLTTFVVETGMGTKQIGAGVTAIHGAGFAAMRFASIFAAVKFRPIFVMLFSFILCIVGSVCLLIVGSSSLLALQICSCLLGIGMASIFATGLLWAEEHIVITNRVGSVFHIGGSLGADLFPILLGQTIEEIPMSLMYILFGTVVSCIIIFGLLVLIGRNLKVSKKDIEEFKETAMAIVNS